MATVETKVQISAGGVVLRPRRGKIYVALISVGEERRWQLPKGIIEKNEPAEIAAMREVSEETGIETDLIEMIEKSEYWYFATDNGKRVRYHKFVYFYLLRYRSGSVKNHDAEVNEAKWFEIGEAVEKLAFDGERKVLIRAREVIDAMTPLNNGKR
jgi:8-oxo-dGTP diphosphatase